MRNKSNNGPEADPGTTGDAGSPLRLRMIACAALVVHPWIQAFDRLADPLAFAVGGVVLRTLVPGGREPRDLDVQYEGEAAAAAQLQARLRADGVPANVRSLRDGVTSDMLTHAAGWRRVKYQAGWLEMDPLAALFVERRIAVIVEGLPDSHLAEKSGAWVLKEYPGATIERR